MKDNTSNTMHKWAIGKHVKIHDCICWHKFEIGQVVEIIGQEGLNWLCSDGKDEWYVTEDEATVCEPPNIKANVSSMFSAEQMEKAYNDGVEAEQQRCGDFDIENYC